jgi:hypothetical protein
MHIKLARITTLSYLIKEADQMKVGISANNEAKVQIAKYYFEVKINPKNYKFMPKGRKKDNVATNKT